MSVAIRRIEARDEPRWRELWNGYCRFYEREPSAPVTRHAWVRIMDPESPVNAIVAERSDGRVIGMANYIVHDNTAMLTPVCYLQDLFVAPEGRGQGRGSALIDHVAADAAAKGSSRVYWLTHESNATARALYDKVAQRSGFIQYRRNLPAS